MRRFLLVVAVMVVASLPSAAGPRDDLLAAYSSEDYTLAWTLAMPLAQSGDEIAEFITGKLLRDGQGTAKDNAQAVVWLRKAAEKGNTSAQEELGSVLGFELKQPNEAKVWLQKAVDAKFPPAFKDLGWLIENDGGSEANLAAAAELYRQGAELHDTDSQALYAKALLNGRGVPADPKKAAELYCQLPSDQSQRQCAKLKMAKALPGVDPMEGFNLLIKLADGGDDEAQVLVSNALLTGDNVPKNIDEGLRRLRLLQAKDIPVAYYNLGWLASQGIGMPKDLPAALDWYKKASEKGYVTAARQAGDLLWRGVSGKPDQAEAIRYYRIGVEKGDDYASYALAVALSSADDPLKDELAASDIFCALKTADGLYQCANLMLAEKTRKNDPDRAIALMKNASDQGSLPALVDLGYYTMNGKYVAKDLIEGIRLTKLAVDKGSAIAMNNMGSYYETGFGVPADAKQAMAWYKKSADAGNVAGLVSLGYLLNSRSSEVYDAAAAAQYFKKASDLGNADGQLEYGYALLNGTGLAKDPLAASDAFCALSTPIGRYECAYMNITGTSRQRDVRQGFMELAKLSDEGFAKAQSELGYRFLEGVGLRKDVKTGVHLIELAAAQNEPTAVGNMGYLYQSGVGGYHKDLSIAAQKFEQAAKLGNTYSMVKLGKLLESNSLGQPDLPRALAFYQNAADAGDAEAQKLAANLIKRGVSPVLDFLPPK